MLRPRRHASPPAAALILTAVTLVGSGKLARAQAEPGQPTPQPPSTHTTFTSTQLPSLQDLLEKVIWNPSRNGPLLIIAPGTTVAQQADPFNGQPSGITFTSNSRVKVPEPDAQGNYRLSDLGEHFGRQVRAVGSLTVFAPTTMTALASRLPKPDPYAGMGNNEKLRLFQSLLTPAQWRIVGSSGGIGLGDLDDRQRELFLSLLPEPFVAQPLRRDDSGRRIHYFNIGSDDSVTLTAAQRRDVRLTLRRVLDWSFVRKADGSGGRSHIGLGETPNRDERYALLGSGFGANFPRDHNTLIGMPVLEKTANRLKPGQLPFDWSGLDAPVALEGAERVGDLIKRVVARTRVPLYCDPRYASLPVYTRSSGRSVRAGDLLQAVCWAVTGTFRKVGSDGGGAAYVLTDDLEGLGTRHARLQAWANANVALAEQRRDDVEEALAKAPVADNLGWADSDAQRPGDALVQKIEAYRKRSREPRPQAAGTSTPQTYQGLLIPVAELPAAAQEMVRKQLESHAKSQEGEAYDPVFSAPLLTDRVDLDVQVQAAFVVPVLGTISAQGSSSSSDASQSLLMDSPRRRRREVPVFGTLPTPKAIKQIPAVYKQRALLVAVRTAEEARRAVAAAQAHGLNQVWIDVLPAQPGTAENTNDAVLAAALAAGKDANLSIGAVVRVLRVPASQTETSATALILDRNIVGETTAAFAARRALASPPVTPFLSPIQSALTPRQEASRLLRLGNWLAPEAPIAQALQKRVAAIAQTPGLAGLVLRDVVPPGYNNPATPSMLDFQGGDEQMGYTDGMRLAFLRETGIDPVDLSPLPQGRLSLPFGGSYSPFLQMQLPFFPDYGPSSSSSLVNGQNARKLGAKDAWEHWKRFRVEKANATVQSIARALRARQPELPVWLQRNGEMFGSSALVPLSDTTVAVSLPAVSPTTPTPKSAPALPGTRTSRVAVASQGANAEPPPVRSLLLIRCAPLPEATDAPPATGVNPADNFTFRLASAMNRPAPGWQGVVIDLSEVPLDRALTLLTLLPSALSPAQ